MLCTMGPGRGSVPRIWGRCQACFLLQSSHHGPECEGAFQAGVVGAGTLFEGQNPVGDVVAHHLLQVFERITQVEGVLARAGVEDGEDVTFVGGYVGGLGLGWRGGWLEGIGDHAEGRCPRGVGGPEPFQKVIWDSNSQCPDHRAAIEVLNRGDVEHGTLDRAEGHPGGE